MDTHPEKLIPESKNDPNKNTHIQVKSVVNVNKQSLIEKGYMNFENWISDKDNVYIGRDMSHYVAGAVGSVWENPFVVAKTGTKYKTNIKRYTLDESLIKYCQYIESNPTLLARLHELNGKTLGCWCKPNRCHGDVLMELVNKHCN